MTGERGSGKGAHVKTQVKESVPSFQRVRIYNYCEFKLQEALNEVKDLDCLGLQNKIREAIDIAITESVYEKSL